jgi:hypothetical protein
MKIIGRNVVTKKSRQSSYNLTYHAMLMMFILTLYFYPLPPQLQVWFIPWKGLLVKPPIFGTVLGTPT